LVVLIVAVAVFRFYRYELRRDVTLPTPKRKYLSYTASTVILAAIVVGIWSIGSPTTQRNIRFDQQRVNDLSSIQSALVGYYLDNNVLPKDLSILAQATTYYVSSLKDPETKDNYEYSVLYVNKYRLCANFASDNLGGDLSTQQVYPTNLDLWTHGIGRTCFDFTAGEIKGVQASPHSLI
jgi:branched-subunit amino acid transport protein